MRNFRTSRRTSLPFQVTKMQYMSVLHDHLFDLLISRLENKVRVLESQQRTELEDMREGKQRLQEVVRRQMEAIEALERQLRAASSNNSALQRQQQQLMTSVHTLIGLVSGGSTTHRPGDHVPF